MALNVASLEGECKKTIEHFKRDLGRVRTGRASPALLEGIVADYYGAPTPLVKLGMINASEPRQLTIQVYDSNACEGIERAIQQSDLGLTPQREGTLIRLNLPPLTEDRRKELIKKTHKMAEETRVVLRNHRRDAIDQMKKQEKAKQITADDVRKGEQEVQKVVDRYSKDIDTLLAQKEKEVMDV